MWVKITTATGLNNLRAIFKQNVLQVSYQGIAGDQMRVQLQTSSGNNGVSSMSAFPVGVVQHFGWSYDGANIRCYVNGILERTNPLTGTIVNNGNTTYIGNEFGGFNQFPGEIWDLRYYSRVLTADEFANITEGQGNDSTSGYASQFLMNEGADGTTVAGFDGVKDTGPFTFQATGTNGPDYMATDYLTF